MQRILSYLPEKYFYAAMSLLIMAIVVGGFGRTVDRNLIHAAGHPPLIEYIHALVFSGWIILLLIQIALVRSARVRLHRTLGQTGFVLGCSMPVLGIATKIAVLDKLTNPDPAELAFMAVSLNDMLCFGSLFLLAMVFRKKREFHRRFILMATCCLTVAAFARMPNWLVVPPWWYAYVDSLIIFGAVRDKIVGLSVHPVYLHSLPVIILGQGAAMYLFLQAPDWWVSLICALVT